MKSVVSVSVAVATIAIAPFLPITIPVTSESVTSPSAALVALTEEEKGFQDGLNAAKNGGENFPAFDQSEQYKRGYYSGFRQYSEGFKEGVEAARNGRPPTLITNPPKIYRQAYEEGFVSVAGKPATACLKEAYRRNLPSPTVGADKTAAGEGVEINTQRGVYICRLRRGRVVGLSRKE